jgi:chemotaxis family two-component system sensor histidine kinase/response regulator PixL
MADLWQNCEKEVLNWLGIQTIQPTPEQQTMVSNLDLDREQIYVDFLHEAQELLQAIEQELLSLRDNYSAAKVHNLMRAAHTLKGSSASMELHNLSQIAHGLEGIFKSLYNPDLVIDEELESLLLQAYEYLQLAVAEATMRRAKNDPEALNQAASVLAEVQQKLGEHYNPDADIPSSVELGFDIVGSIFEVGVQQRIEELERVIETGNIDEIVETLQSATTIFIGLAESLNLPGFGKIAQLSRLAMQLHPDRVLEIAPIALDNFSKAQEVVLAGDREIGGTPSTALQAWVADNTQTVSIPKPPPEPDAFDLTSESLFDAPTTIDIEVSNDFDLNASPFFEQEETAIAREEQVEATPPPPPADEPSLDSIFGNLNPTEFESFSALEPDLLETEAIKAEMPLETEQNRRSVQADAAIATETNNQAVTAAPEILSTPNTAEPDVETATHPAAVAEQEPESKPSLPSFAATPQTVRVELERLERLNFQAGELLINQNKQVVQSEQLLAAFRDLRSRMQKHARTLNHLMSWQLGNEGNRSEVAPPQAASEAHPSTFCLADLDSLEFDQYSELHLLLQKATEEMVQMEESAEILELFTRTGSQTLEKQQRLLKGVRDDLTRARMQEFSGIIGRLERVVQQLSSTYRKTIDFRIEGATVLIDKAIAQQLYDPLLHLVRNAFAHGIESSQERQNLGKPEIGQISIRAYNQGNRTAIEVKDDGRGLDYAKIRDRAFESGLIAPEEGDRLTPEQLQPFIFQPGFSTASDTDNLRGRGVGLDVVKSHLDALGATLIVNSQANRGTTFTLRLPLTLSIAKLIVCQVGELAYALPADSIEQIVLLQPGQIKQVGSQRALQWQENANNGNSSAEYTIPLHRLHDLIDYTSPLAASHRHSTLASAMVMLLNLKDGLVGIEVDRVVGEQELAIRPLGNAIAPPHYIDGCSVLGDNRLALVLDLVALVESTLVERSEPPLGVEASFPRPSQPILPPSAAPPRSSILIIDDSITLRRNLTYTLKKAGYSVLEASDGFDAIAQLEEYPTQISLIVSDLEMPQMNGFELISYCQQHPHYQNIPILVLTSRQSDKHRQIALNLGASDYITKPYLERSLLNKIAEYLPLAVASN